MRTTTGALDKSKPPIITKVMYIVGSVIGLIAIALLVSNILIFRDTVAQYVAQGYPSAQVVKQLIPGQLLPGVFEPIAVYGGIAFILFASGMINQKVSQCLILLKPEVYVESNDGHAEDVEKINGVDQ